MIGKLTGIVDSCGGDLVVLDVNGVGYVVHCPDRTLRALPPPGRPASLAIETQVREDSIRLFGFATPAERDWFRLLQTVQGVGGKVALAILGILAADELAAAIAHQDKATVARAPGVGPRLAARIVAELKDKAPASQAAGQAAVGSAAAALPSDTAAGPVRDAVTALVGLGFPQPKAEAAVAASLRMLDGAPDAAGLIRRSLRSLAQP